MLNMHFLIPSMVIVLWIIAIIIMASAIVYYIWFYCSPETLVIPASPYIDFQSTVIDVKNGLRAPTRKYEFDPPFNLNSVFDIFLWGLKISRTKPCFGIRKSLDDPVNWLTYEEVHEQILNAGSGLIKLSGTSTPGKRFLGIYARNSPQWIIMEYACAAYSFVVVPLYHTYDDEALTNILNEVELETIFCDSVKSAERIWNLAQSKIKNLIILECDNKMSEMKSKLKDQTQVSSYHELIALGQQNRSELQLPKKEDLFMILYTSGSTGVPKGVMITHGRFLNNANAACLMKKDPRAEYIQPVHLSYLPLAHIMEQLMICLLFLAGGRAGFLTSSVEFLKNDFQCYKPFALCAVPRILLRIYSESTKLLHSNFVFRRLSNYLIDKRVEEQKKGIYNRNEFLDRILFKRIREAFGGQVQTVTIGGAPVSKEVLQLIRAVFACPVLNGYGSTETSAITATLVGDMEQNHVGAIVPGCLVKLADVPDMDMIVARDGIGEICVLSHTNTIGYYKKPELTQELFDKDGYVRTGDIGTWLPNGSLKILDRCKNIFKLSQGEYVAPEKVEKIYGLSDLVFQIFVDGNSLQSYCVAIVVPNFESLSQSMSNWFEKKQWNMNKLGPERDRMKCEICRDAEVRRFILESINQIGKERGLKGFEMVKAIYLSPKPFTVENGELTPTFKYSRPKIRRHYADEIAALYGK